MKTIHSPGFGVFIGFAAADREEYNRQCSDISVFRSICNEVFQMPTDRVRLFTLPTDETADLNGYMLHQVIYQIVKLLMENTNTGNKHLIILHISGHGYPSEADKRGTKTSDIRIYSDPSRGGPSYSWDMMESWLLRPTDKVLSLMLANIDILGIIDCSCDFKFERIRDIGDPEQRRIIRLISSAPRSSVQVDIANGIDAASHTPSLIKIFSEALRKLVKDGIEAAELPDLCFLLLAKDVSDGTQFDEIEFEKSYPGRPAPLRPDHYTGLGVAKDSNTKSELLASRWAPKSKVAS